MMDFRLSQKAQYTLFCICIGFILLRGSESLECYNCTDSMCINQIPTECGAAKNICTEFIVLLRTGSQSLTVRHKGCGSGSATIGFSQKSSDGLVSLLYKSGCSTSLCNQRTTNTDMFPTPSPDEERPENATECKNCVDTDKSRCSEQNSQKIKCPQGQDQCFKGTGSLVIDNVPQPVFIQKCSSPACPSLNYTDKWHSLSVSGSCCSGNNCNEHLEDTTTSTSTTVTTSTGTTGTTSTGTTGTTSMGTMDTGTIDATTDFSTKLPDTTTKSGAVPSANSVSRYSLLMAFAVSAILKF